MKRDAARGAMRAALWYQPSGKTQDGECMDRLYMPLATENEDSNIICFCVTPVYSLVPSVTFCSCGVLVRGLL